MNEAKLIIDRLDEIKSELGTIKRHMIDVDMVLTDDDLESLKEADRDFKAGNTKRL